MLKNLVLGLGFLFLLLILPANSHAQNAAIINSLNWLKSSQSVNGSWNNGQSLSTDYYTAATVLETFTALGDASASYTNGLDWLSNEKAESTTYLAPRIRIVAFFGGDTTTDVNTLLSYRSSSAGWGGYLNQEISNFHTALALQALKAANYTDQSITFGAISYLLSTQNTDGGWGFTQGDNSNVYVTSLALSALAQFKSVNIMDQQLAKAAALLVSAQNADGGFGSGPSTIYETALAFIALIESGQNGAQQAAPLQNALNYLTSTQLADGSWNADPYSTALALRALAYVKPDLAVAAADITASPAAPKTGDSLTVAVTVHNTGLEAASNVAVRLLDNGVTVSDQTIPSVTPGASVPATFTIAPLTPTGEHVFTVAVDPAITINEVSRANNSAALRIWAKALADLVVQPGSLSFAPVSPKPGDNITITANIANMGETDAGPFSADFYDGEPSSGGSKIGSLSFSGVAAGQWGNSTLTFSLATAGAHSLYLVADAQNAIPEQNKTNNSANASIVIGGTAGLADLAILPGSVQIAPARPRNGDATTITILAHNLGSASATANLEVFDAMPNAGGTLLHQETITLNTGESRTVSVPWTATPGIHTMYAVIDRANLVAEADKSNNGQTLVFMTDMVDIEVSASDIYIDPEHPMDGDPATVKVTVQNKGITATGPFNVTLYNGDPNNGGTLLQTFPLSTLAGDGTQELDYPFTAASGTYRFYAVCDPDNRVIEADEDNNLAIRSLLVKSSSEAKGPDLVPLEFDLSGTTTDPQSLRISGMAMVKFQNKGDDKVSTPLRITIFEDRDGDGLYTEATDLTLGYWDYSSPMNPNMAGLVSVSLSGTLIFRDAPIYAMLDSGQAVFEQNETNNTIRRGSACENRPSNPIQPVLKWQWRTYQPTDPSWGTHNRDNIYSLPVVLKEPDGQGGKRTIILIIGQILGPNGLVGQLHALDGKTGNELFSYYNSAHEFSYVTRVATGDINNDGMPEILIGRDDNIPAKLLCLNHDGALLWDNSSSVNSWYQQNPGHNSANGGSSYPAIADIDGDGNPEIIAGSAILNANGSIRSAGLTLHSTYPYVKNGTGTGNTLSNYPLVADIDLDGKQEIVAGNTVYDSTSVVRWFNGSLPDGLNAILNSDDDPYPEIVFTSYLPGTTVRVYLLGHDGRIIWGPVNIASLDSSPYWIKGGPPIVADFDGDGQPEIGIKAYGKFIILDKNGRLKMTLDISPGDYSAVAPTVFDLNGDGKPEIIINSGNYFRVFDGATGTKLYETPFGADDYERTTKHQPAIVADVNDDGHAEIVVVGGYTKLMPKPISDSPEKGIKVYGASNNDWQGTRGVWNQASYHVTNVNDDGSIPQYEAPSWLLNNNYLCNIPTSSGTNPYLAADISASYVRVDMEGYPSSVAVTARIGNGGAQAVDAGLKVVFYDGDPANGGTLIGTVVTTKVLNPGDYEDVTLTWNTPAQGNHSAYIIADPDNTVAECDKTNNVVSIPIYVTSGVPDPAVAADDVVLSSSIPEGSLINIVITVRNLGAMQVNNVPVRLYAGNPATGGKQIGADHTIPALPAGGAATVCFTWNTLGSQGATYLYALVDPLTTIADSNRGNNTAIKQVQVTAAVKPDLQIAVGDITVTPAAPAEGDTLTVTATVHNLGVAAGNIKAALYNGNPATGGSLIGTASIPQAIPQGGSAPATFTVNTIGLTGTVALFVKVDPDNLIDESDKSNNQAGKAIFVNVAGLSLAVGTDKTSYGANENVQARITVAETTGQPRDLAYDLLILDKNGVLTATVTSGVPFALAANSSLTVTASWNTAITLSGPYTLRAQVKEGGRTVARSAVAITILPDVRIEAKVTTDKISYNPHETATLTATATSLGVNTVLENLTATVTVRDTQGTARFTDAKSITSLVPGAAFTFKSYWNTGKFAPGSYPVTIEVKDASAALLATGTQALEISSIIKPSAVLKGQVSVDKQSVLSGDNVNISYSVTNTGNVDLPNVNLSLLTVHVVNQSVYDTLTYQTPLPMGATYTNSGLIDTTVYSAKDYLVVLRASIDGVEETLAGTYFRVEGAPSAPALSTPANGADVETFTPALTVSNAADPNDDKLTYEFEIYADTGLTNLIASSGAIPETTGTTTWTVPVPLTENLTYFWRTRAWDGKLYGPWMAPASFRVNTVNDLPTAPTISSPADGTAVAVLTPLLTVNNASDPDSANLTYNFQISLDPDFTQIVVPAKGVAGGQGTTSWTSTESLQENGWYYWRAQADDWLIEGPWSATARFFVNSTNDPPSAPVVTAPASRSTVAVLATDVVVANSTDPDSTTISYYVEADTAPTFDSPDVIRSGAVTEGEGSTIWHLNGLRDNTHYFVRAKASDGAADSPWSPLTEFFANTVNDPPNTPILANPSNGAGVTVSTPTLSVQNSTDPDKDVLTYEFQVYTDAALTTLVTSTTGITETSQITSWTVPVTLTENQTYYWRARANDGSLQSPWMSQASFTINTANDAPGAPVLLSPTDGSTIATLTPTFVITNAKDPDSDKLTYEYEVYQGSVLITSITNVPENSTGTTSATLTTNLTDNTVYQWRARAFDGDRYGAWTAMATFTVHISQTRITVDIDFEPETLNKKDCGKWVLVKIELPHGYKAKDVDISSIRLEGTVHAEPWPYECHDHHHEHGCDHDRHEHNHEVLMVKFKRSEVIAVLPEGRHVPVHVTGVVSSTAFEGVDVIRVIK